MTPTVPQRRPVVEEPRCCVVTVVVPVGEPPALPDVDEAARACLEVRRGGGQVLEVRAPAALLDLLRLAGLGPDCTGGRWAESEDREVRITYVGAPPITPPRAAPPAGR